MAISCPSTNAADASDGFNTQLARIVLDTQSRLPLHEQLREAIRGLIDCRPSEGTVLIPERSLAEALGVSRITVTRALDELRREGRLIRKIGRGTIVAARPPVSAHAQGAGASAAFAPRKRDQIEIGFIGFTCKSDFCSAFIDQLTAECGKQNIALRVHRVGEDRPEVFVANLDTGPDQERFFLFLGDYGGRRIFKALADKGYRTVSLDQMSDYYPGASVATDARAAIRLGLEHLQSLGHKRIALLVNERLREESVLVKVDEFMLETQRRALEGRVVVCDAHVLPSDEAAYAQMDELWRCEPSRRPTGIMTVSDPGAWAVLKWLREHAVPVPGDVSVVGFEDAPPSAHVSPALTSIAHPIIEIARSALDLLLDDDAANKVTRLIAPALKVRESTGPAPQR